MQILRILEKECKMPSDQREFWHPLRRMSQPNSLHQKRGVLKLPVLASKQPMFPCKPFTWESTAVHGLLKSQRTVGAWYISHAYCKYCTGQHEAGRLVLHTLGLNIKEWQIQQKRLHSLEELKGNNSSLSPFF